MLLLLEKTLKTFTTLATNLKWFNQLRVSWLWDRHCSLQWRLTHSYLAKSPVFLGNHVPYFYFYVWHLWRLWLLKVIALTKHTGLAHYQTHCTVHFPEFQWKQLCLFLSVYITGWYALLTSLPYYSASCVFINTRAINTDRSDINISTTLQQRICPSVHSHKYHVVVWYKGKKPLGISLNRYAMAYVRTVNLSTVNHEYQAIVYCDVRC